MRKRIYFISIFVLLFCLAGGTAFSQTNKNSLTNEKKKLEQEIAKQQKLLNETKKNKNTSLREIELILSQIKKREKLIQAINDELSLLDSQIDENTKELTLLEEKLDRSIKEYEHAVYIAYKYRNALKNTSFIISSENIEQAIRRTRYLQQYSATLKRHLLVIQETQAAKRKKEESLKQIKSEKETLLVDKSKEKNNLQKQQVEKDKIVSNLKKKEKQLTAEINKKIKRQKAIDAEIKKIIDAEIAKKGTKPATSKSSKPELKLTPQESALAADFEKNKGVLPWPVEKGAVITNFGTYSHPEVSTVKMPNHGINILTEKSANVRAIFNGVVSAIADLGGGVKVIIIRHGNYLSVYSNMGSVNVKKGDAITTRQIIGKVHTNVGDNDAELHFEIRRESTPLNPALWIKQ